MPLDTFESYSIDVETAMRGIPRGRVLEAVKILRDVKKNDTAVYILGNGGSAATAGHFANDLVKMCGIRAFSVSSMIPLIMAYANDFSYQDVFAEPLRIFLKPGDVVVAISCSGTSPNVLYGIHFAKNYPASLIKSIALTGDNPESPLAKLDPDVLINVPFRDIMVQEDCHMVICHAISKALKIGA